MRVAMQMDMSYSLFKARCHKPQKKDMSFLFFSTILGEQHMVIAVLDEPLVDAEQSS